VHRLHRPARCGSCWDATLPRSMRLDPAIDDAGCLNQENHARLYAEICDWLRILIYHPISYSGRRAGTRIGASAPAGPIDFRRADEPFGTNCRPPVS
jgi:hypothetical protein